MSPAKRNFIIFINPVSGTKNKEAVRLLAEKTLTDHQFPFEILPTERSGHYDFLKEKIGKENITDVIICGGDGTVNQVCSYLRGTNARAGIIPLGSGNGLAFGAGISKNPAKALDIIIKGNATEIDAFMINDRFSCMLCGLGFDAQVAHDFARQSSRGLSAYAKQTAKIFFSAKPYPFRISADGKDIRTEAFFISIANSNQFGNNFTIAPKASLFDGVLDIVIVNRSGKLKFMLNVLKQVRRGKTAANAVDKAGVHYFQTKNLAISNPQMAPLHIDGEPAETAAKFDINIIEKAFWLMMP